MRNRINISRPSTALFVKDISVAKEFYSGVMGMKIDLDFGKNVIYNGGLAIWEISEGHVIPQLLGSGNLSDQGINRFELYFESEDLPETFSHLKDHNVTFLHEIHEEPWGQLTIRFFDPDRHLIEIGESMRSFIMRFHNMGMNAQQISGRTSVPENEVLRIIGQ